jgi:hypothetical protein
MKVGQAYVGEDGQWYFYTEEQLTELAYEKGGVDAYRQKYGRMKKDVDTQFYPAYDRGYEEQPYGMKEYD